MNVTSITDGSGNVVEHYDYGSYGSPFIFDASGSSLTMSAIANPYMFTGRRFDLESRFYYYRTRYYEPTVGRFTTRDTIGIWGDAANLGNASNYVASNPWTWVDPWGLEGTFRGRSGDYLGLEGDPGPGFIAQQGSRYPTIERLVDAVEAELSDNGSDGFDQIVISAHGRPGEVEMAIDDRGYPLSVATLKMLQDFQRNPSDFSPQEQDRMRNMLEVLRRLFESADEVCLFSCNTLRDHPRVLHPDDIPGRGTEFLELLLELGLLDGERTITGYDSFVMHRWFFWGYSPFDDWDAIPDERSVTGPPESETDCGDSE